MIQRSPIGSAPCVIMGRAEKHRSEVVGGNARMMELVAAMLDIKLARLEAATEERRRVAARYQDLLGGHPAIEVPIEAPWATSAYHVYVIHVDRRDRVRDLLAARGIGTGLHYPIPLHLQPAYRHLGYVPGTFPVAERKAARLISLPMFPELTDDEIELVAKSLLDVAHTLERM
jgi:dTDP-4-amino-4,6-dideoxygalactose transaminase